jgi:DNA-binding response OmpR family regulator
MRGIPFLQSDAAESGRILVADADTDVRELVADAIRAVDDRFAVELVSDAFAAGRTLAAFRPALVFLDQRMPGLDALDICERLGHESETPVAVVVLLAGAAADAERAFKSRGALGCIVKPPSRAAIERMVRQAFHLTEGVGAPAIHVLEKDMRSARTLRRDLEARVPGCRVTVFESSLDLAFALGSETPDALIVDAGALELNAVELVRKVVARGGGAPAVIVVASPRADVSPGPLMAAGARTLLNKPVGVDDVLQALDERRRGGRVTRRDPKR